MLSKSVKGFRFCGPHHKVTRLLFWGGVLEKGYSRDACTDFDAKYVKLRGTASFDVFSVEIGARVLAVAFPKNQKK